MEPGTIKGIADVAKKACILVSNLAEESSGGLNTGTTRHGSRGQGVLITEFKAIIRVEHRTGFAVYALTSSKKCWASRGP